MADVLSAFIQVLLEDWISAVLKDVNFRSVVEDELQNLTQNFSIIKKFLEDAQERQHIDSAVRSWLTDLRDVAYDMNDVLDEVATEDQRRRLVPLAQVRKILTPVNPKRRMFMHEIFGSIKDITKKFNNLVQKGQNFGFRVLDAPMHRGELPPSTSLSPPSTLGREDDRNRIVQLVVSSGAHGEGISVLPIVGMCGLGKTTLAQLVYNDERVQKHFDRTLWVSVSQDFNIKRITKAMIESIDNSGYDPITLDSLQKHLREKLNGKIYLLVLDDVWNESRQEWDRLRVPLLYGAKGSKILVTTRNQEVADMMRTSPPYYLRGLSDGDCWSLFCQYALDQNLYPNHELSSIKREIVKKCNHLPLAVIALGCRLRRESDVGKWKHILQNETWEFSGQDGDISCAVSSSYHHLPMHLKPCFAYCSVIPKGYEFEKEALIHWWMAQNFIQPRGGERIEDTGSCYFDSLVRRSFIRLSHFNYKNNQPRYTMHSLIHDFAQHISGEECCIAYSDTPSKISDKTRHCTLVYRQLIADDSTSSRTSWTSTRRRSDFATALDSKGLYTLIVTGPMPYGMEVPVDLASRWKRLRNLDFSNSGITTLPKSIGDLQHLRCLRLCNTDIKWLPESVGNLYNLQTLALGNCYMLEELPKDTRNLCKLRHLDLHLDDESMALGDNSRQQKWGSLRLMPPKIGLLTELQTLSRFVVSRGEACGLKELHDLNDIHGELHISNLHLVWNASEAVEANLSSKQYLRCLKLMWSFDGSICRNLRVERDVLGGLRPHTNLKELQIVGYGGASFPDWIGRSSFSNLVTLCLLDCKRCENLPPLGQLPVLKDLFIKGVDGVQIMNCSFCGTGYLPFPSLEKLHLESMARLQAWYGAETCGLLHLRELVIKDCTDLRQLTHIFPSLTKLEIDGSPRLLGLPSIPSLHNLSVKRSGDWIWRSQNCLASLSSLTLAMFPSETFPPVQESALASLCRLEITHCDDLISLPDGWLPTGLTYFGIKYCPQLRALPDGIYNLRALEDLEIQDCRRLSSLPDRLSNLTSLVRIEISDCFSLQSLPRDGLPSKLQFLSINNCPTLTQRCRRGGQDWEKIDHIFSVWIDKELVVPTVQLPSASHSIPQHHGQGARS